VFYNATSEPQDQDQDRLFDFTLLIKITYQKLNCKLNQNQPEEDLNQNQ